MIENIPAGNLAVGDEVLVALHRDEPFRCTVTDVAPTGSVKFGQVGPSATPILRVSFDGMPRPFAGRLEIAADQVVEVVR